MTLWPQPYELDHSPQNQQKAKYNMATTTRLVVYGERPSRRGDRVAWYGMAPLMAPIKRPRCAKDRGAPKAFLAPFPLSDSAYVHTARIAICGIQSAD